MDTVKSIVILLLSLFVGWCIVRALQLEGIARMAAYFICGYLGSGINRRL